MLRHKPTRISLDETDVHFHLSHIYARHPEYYYYYEGDDDMDDQLSLHSDTPSSSVPTHISESICDGEGVAPAGQNPYPGLRYNTTADIVLSSRSSSLVPNPGSDMSEIGASTCARRAYQVSGSVDEEGSSSEENSSFTGSDSDDEIAIKPLKWSGASRSPWVTARYAKNKHCSLPPDHSCAIRPAAQPASPRLHTALFSTVYDRVLRFLPTQQDLFHPLKPLLYSPLPQDLCESVAPSKAVTTGDNCQTQINNTGTEHHSLFVCIVMVDTDKPESPTQTCLRLNRDIEELCTNTTCDTDNHSTGGLIVHLTNLIDLALSSLPGDTVSQAKRMAKRGRARNKQIKAGVRETPPGIVSMDVEDGNNPVWDINANANLPHAEEVSTGIPT